MGSGLKLFRWIALTALAACATPPAGDGVTVVWNRVEDVQSVCQNLAGRKEIFAIRGCSKWTDNGSERVCSIYVPTPKNEADTRTFATLGHELMHCFDGNWHDRWGRMVPPDVQAGAGGTKKRGAAAASD